MKAVTIDQLDIKEHVRWAQDQLDFDIALIKDTHVIAHHPEIIGTSSIYPSKFDELFELQKRNPSWACFSPPHNFHAFNKRVFSHQLFPTLSWDDQEQGEQESSEEDEASDRIVQLVGKLKKLSNQTPAALEKDRSSILGALESIRWINHLLKQIYARKLQYQKG